jgi:hypothetical protein
VVGSNALEGGQLQHILRCHLDMEEGGLVLTLSP